MKNAIRVCLTTILLCACAYAQRDANPRVTPIAVPGTPSPLFALRVEGQSVPVTSFKDIHYAHFTLTGPAQVEVVRRNGAVTRARIQPTPYGITAAIDANRARFTVPRTMQLVVQIDYLEKLFLFADPPAEPPPPDAVNARDAGAVGDGRTDNTAALQTAIDALPVNGTLYLPSGHFRSGSLRLHSDMALHLAPGALLQAVDDPARMAPIPGAPSMIAYLLSEGATNLTVKGLGTVDANGFVIRRACERAENIKKKAGRAVFMRNGKNVTLQGITVRDSYSWNVDAQFVDALTIAGVKILSDVRLSNHDGFDIESCRDVLVEDCFVFSEDDGLTPKAREGRATVERHTFRNCVLWAHKANGIRIGSESACLAMRDLTFENIFILNAADGIRLDTTEGAVFENIVFRNVWMEDFLEFYDGRYERNRERQPIHPSRSIVLHVTRSEKRGTFTPLGRIRKVTFENVHWNDHRVPASIILPDAVKKFAAETRQEPLIENLTFIRCSRAGKPVKSAADAGFFANDANVTSSFTFE